MSSITKDVNVWVSVKDDDFIDPYLTQYESCYDNDMLGMSLHPEWAALMEDLKVGDPVSTYDNKVGIIIKITDETGFGFKVYDVACDGQVEKYFAMNLRKFEEKK